MNKARAVFVLILLSGALDGGFGQTSLKLPLPVTSPSGATRFEASSPLDAVLTGFLWPSSGALLSWAPVYSTLEADGSLKEWGPGPWFGPRPPRWIKVVRPGAVVGGMRLLVKIGPGTVETRQAQVFWKVWTDGEPQGPIVPSSVHGLAAEAKDEVRIIELTVPARAVPTGLYGETLGGRVVQASLMVRPATVSTQTEDPQPVPGLKAPGAPSAPTLSPLAPIPLRDISQE